MIARRILQLNDMKRSKDKCILNRVMLRCSWMISFALLKYLRQSKWMILWLYESLLIIVLSIYSIILRNDSASISLKKWWWSIIHSIISLSQDDEIDSCFWFIFFKYDLIYRKFINFSMFICISEINRCIWDCNDREN